MKNKIIISLVACFIAAGSFVHYNFSQNNHNNDISMADISVMAQADGESGDDCGGCPAGYTCYNGVCEQHQQARNEGCTTSEWCWSCWCIRDCNGHEVTCYAWSSGSFPCDNDPCFCDNSPC